MKYGANAEINYYPLYLYTKPQNPFPRGKSSCVDPVYLNSCNDLKVRRGLLTHPIHPFIHPIPSLSMIWRGKVRKKEKKNPFPLKRR